MINNSMKKIWHIIQGWWLYLFRRTSPMARKRMDVCVDCDARIGRECGKCGCFIPAKAEIIDEECPRNKWD